MSKVYRIKDWLNQYEVNASGRPARGETDPLRTGPLDYIRLKVFGKSLDSGYRRLLDVAGKTRAMMVFGYFVKFLELAGDETSNNRGGILRNEKHEEASDEDLAFLLDLPIRQIRYATGVLANIGWMEIQDKDGVEVHANSLNSADTAKISDASERNGNEKNNLKLLETRKASGDLRNPVLSAPSTSNSAPAPQGSAGFSISITNSTSLNLQALNFYEALIGIIAPRTQADRTGFRNISNWLKNQCTDGVFELQVFTQVLQFATESLHARNPAAALMGRLKKELGYDPKRLLK